MKNAQAVIAEEFKSFFDANPDVKAVMWTQYTPHFNDGDVCEFSRHEFYLSGEFGTDLKSNYKDTPDYEVDGKAFFSDYSFIDGSSFKKVLDPLESALRDTDDVFKSAFGDGYQIVATRKGFKVEEYDHD